MEGWRSNAITGFIRYTVMAEGKKSFIAYADWKNIFDELPDEDAGKLIKHIFAYVNDENPETESILIRAVFANIKTTLKRDLDRWESQLNQRRNAGKASAVSRSTKINGRSTVVQSRRRNSTDNVSVSVSDNVNENKIKTYYRKFLHLKLSFEEFEKLKVNYSQSQIDSILDAIENYKGNNKYTSLFLTAKKWLEKEAPPQQQIIKPKYLTLEELNK